MTRPHRYVIRMLFFLVAIGSVCALLYKTLYRAFMSNPALDGLILGVMAIGILWNIRVVLRLRPEIRWAETLRQSRAALVQPAPPRMLAPLGRLLTLHSSSKHISLPSHACQTALDSLSGRLDESREISRYLTNLLIFLGLLGTFYGLLLTVHSIAGVIGGLSAGDQNLDIMFDQLKAGLARPLQGMATAFSGSMFGLAGALILGFLDLTAGQAQNRFFNEIEEWLVGQVGTEGAQGAERAVAALPSYVTALLEQMAENLENLQRVLGQNTEDRVRLATVLNNLQDRMHQSADVLSLNQRAMARIADATASLSPYLKHLSETAASDAQADSVPSQIVKRLDKLDMGLTGLSALVNSGRTDIVDEIRNGTRLMAKTLAATGADGSGKGT